MFKELFLILFFGYNIIVEKLQHIPIQDWGDREIVAADSRLFPASKKDCEYWLQFISEHIYKRKDEVKTWNKPSKFFMWEMDIEYRRLCWFYLNKAKDTEKINFSYVSYVSENNQIKTVKIYSRNTTRDRIEALYKLRDLLGYECFYAGIMPEPIPNYHINER